VGRAMGIGVGNGGKGFLYSHEDGSHASYSPKEMTACLLYVKGKRCLKPLVWRNRPKVKA